MSLNANEISSGGKRLTAPLDPGTYPARLVGVATLGIQEQRPYNEEVKAPKLEIMITYELLDEFLKDADGNDMLDKPRWISETMAFTNLKADRAKSTQRYFALDPKQSVNGDWGSLLGTPCMVTLVHNVNKITKAVWEQVASISSMRPKEAEKAPALVNPPKVFDFYNPNMEVFNAFPEWVKTKIKKALDFKGSLLEDALFLADGEGSVGKHEELATEKDNVKTPDTEW